MTQDELLRRIREKPWVFLGTTSVTALQHFNSGYTVREWMATGTCGEGLYPGFKFNCWVGEKLSEA